MLTIFHFGWSEFIPPRGISSDPPNFLQIFVFAGPSSSHLVGSTRTFPIFRNFSFWVVRVHPASWDQLGPSHFFSRWSELIPPPGINSDLPGFSQFFILGGPSSSHLVGSARTLPIFCEFSFSMVRVHPTSWDQLGPSQIFAIFHFGWSEFIPPPGTSSDPSQIFANFCFGWSELIPPPGTSSDPSRRHGVATTAAIVAPRRSPRRRAAA